MNYWLLPTFGKINTLSILDPKPPEQNIGHGSLDEFIEN